MKINENVMKEMDFRFLEGRKIELIGLASDVGVIVGCDYNIGMTIMDEQKEEYLICLRGPATWRRFKIESSKYLLEAYDVKFNELVNSIIDMNKIYVGGVYNGSSSIHTTTNSETCAFN